MAGVNETSRRGRRSELLGGAASPAPSIPASDIVPAPPAAAAPIDGAVLPDPTLVAVPGAPQPIVTASPPLAAEADAMDVVEAAAAADRVASGLEPSTEIDGRHPAIAGQTMLTIDRSAVAENSVELSPRIEAGSTDRGEQSGADAAPTIDVIIAGLEHLARTDPTGMDIIRASFFGGEPRDRLKSGVDQLAKGRTITVYEVVGPANGRRRAGRSFGPKALRILASDLTREEIASLRSDPLLAVGVSEVEADAFGYPIHDL